MEATKPILIAYDGSPSAKAAIEAAGRLFSGRRATVLAVWRSSVDAASASLAAIPAPVAAHAYEQLDEESKQRAAATAAEGEQVARDAGLDAGASTAVCRGKVWATIADTAESEDAEAIVVGTRGLSTVKSALLGSVANGLVHHSPRPVLVVSAP
jgi:nucleotide-binding universal stress UspA family protein